MHVCTRECTSALDFTPAKPGQMEAGEPAPRCWGSSGCPPGPPRWPECARLSRKTRTRANACITGTPCTPELVQ
eukprot:3950950-Lingulodinium_polyedra.AAC.1